ncbi:hypothetical protein KKB55_16555 [Myxococcota bacterium]|nr:hypothetical protein [Myxococcota bacterium]
MSLTSATRQRLAEAAHLHLSPQALTVLVEGLCPITPRAARVDVLEIGPIVGEPEAPQKPPAPALLSGRALLAQAPHHEEGAFMIPWRARDQRA